VRRTGDLPTDKVRRSAHIDLEAAFTCLDAADLVDAGVVAIHLARGVVGATADKATLREADHHLSTSLHSLAGVVVRVLFTADDQVVADVGDYLIALQLRTF